MFFNTFLNMACGLQLLAQSRNNNNRPNKKNDVITDLGGEGNFPMFLSGHPLSLIFGRSPAYRAGRLPAILFRTSLP